MSLKAPRTPFGYQQEGIDFLVDHSMGALWDEPGLGKTMQAIMAARRLGGPVLVVCPSVLRPWWKKEILELYPDDDVIVAGQAGRIEQMRGHERYETYPHYIKQRLEADGVPYPTWTICHYTGIRLSQKYYKLINWQVVVLDESHYIKNRRTKRTSAVYNVTPPLASRITLTATPFGKQPDDLWSQLLWMAPDVEGLQSYWRFFNLFVDYAWEKLDNGRRYRKIKGGKNLDVLAQVMSRYGLQRTKKDVAPQLPPLIETEMPLPLEGRQADVYKIMKDKSRVELVIRHTPTLEKDGPPPAGGVQYTGLLIKNAMVRILRMEQWLSHPWTMDPSVTGTKLDWLLEWAKGYRHPAVIVTLFKESAKRIHQELGACAGTRPISGEVPIKLRGPIMEAWCNGENQFLVGTIHTLGTGLNLQRGYSLVCYDQTYNPILMDQVSHRIHRLTTDHNVQVIYLYVEGTSNEVVLKAFRQKWGEMRLVKEFLRYLQREV